MILEEIVNVVYCCLILRNMAVEEKVKSCHDKPESADISDCIEEDYNVDVKSTPEV